MAGALRIVDEAGGGLLRGDVLAVREGKAEELGPEPRALVHVRHAHGHVVDADNETFKKLARHSSLLQAIYAA